MRISDVMSGFVHTVKSTASLSEAGQMMGLFDLGFLPVVDDGELLGVVTDRDLVVRGIAEGLHPGTSVMRVMSADVKRCRADDSFEHVLEVMGNEQVRRMPVCTKHGELVGVVSLADFAWREKHRDEVTAALRNICRTAGHHTQHLRVA